MKVLIVAKCIVNENIKGIFKRLLAVLIVAKCIVNKLDNHLKILF